ncbi:hypothetical protein GCM10012290_11840 [Halolactibacillus alkaliphilus]|uniref:Flagellar protein FlaG n=1 Tax=Halolactibacillus alkaliphilus TaxID=442899 RepID=A0A511X0T5_9BACI|nr:flagellar protein FlaG [Halolactibacillus alkaliphilus]GEN56554.1 hypothetical protein HAL01_10180 [Halolactibacillus alkaliphilus]GGN69285.1 hypothetical protein GCM10012290_11840 [Halolactibacillus alkaliphilus]SFO75113.1 flagellar protein FlaG [Halolactibacillus alkaliphilus]
MELGRLITSHPSTVQPNENHQTRHVEQSFVIESNTQQETTKQKHTKEPTLDRAQVESMIEGLNDFLEPLETSLKFELHDKLDRYYVKVVDSKTDELVREIPPEKMLDMYAQMFEFMGFIVDEKI